MHYFWWRSRLLWIERNCLFPERKRLYRSQIFPELWKHLRHYLLKTVQSALARLLFCKVDAVHREKALRYRAGLLGALHYSLGKFGNCPRWLAKR